MIALLCLLACLEDDYAGPEDGDDTGAGADTAADDTADTGGNTDTDTNGSDLALVGDWRSEGDGISPLLQYFDIVRVDATFAADGTYLVTSLDADGQQTEYVGTYVADDGTTPGSVTLTQSSPYVATSVGIWQVDGTTLTYEVAQTQPDYGWSPATPESGFGSTTGGNLDPGDNVQVYVRR